MQPQAEYNLALHYEREQDLPKAAAWYRKAALAGYAPAQNRLAHCYEFGKGVQPDIKTAIAWYEKAAAQNVSDAQNSLAICLLLEDTHTHAQAAQAWLEKAAAEGHVLATTNLGLMYHSGICVPRNLETARNFFEKTAVLGEGRGLLNLGIYHENGQAGFSPDDKKAAEYYLRVLGCQKSAPAIPALKRLAEFYSQGKGGLPRSPHCQQVCQHIVALLEADQYAVLKQLPYLFRTPSQPETVFFPVRKARQTPSFDETVYESLPTLFTETPAPLVINWDNTKNGHDHGKRTERSSCVAMRKL